MATGQGNETPVTRRNPTRENHCIDHIMKPLRDNPRIHKISVAEKKGERKKNIDHATVVAGGGIQGDAHGSSARPLSLLPLESFVKVRHPDLDVHPGDFAENITTVELDFTHLTIGTRLRLGKSVEVEIIQIGKECHNGCVIRQTVGDCIMPREGVFARIITGGEISAGDPIEILVEV
ncbi:MAG: MOSC domain-containing protein [bacterium]